MTRKKFLILFGSFFVFLFMFFFLLRLFLGTNKQNSINVFLPTPTPINFPNGQPVNPQPTPTEIPIETLAPTIAAHSFQDNPPPETPFAKTNQILESISSQDSEGDIIIEQNSQYTILFLPHEDVFSISIFASPFPTVRQEAEQTLLSKLSLSKDQACQLTVVVATTYGANPNFSGSTYGLSFCG